MCFIWWNVLLSFWAYTDINLSVCLRLSRTRKIFLPSIQVYLNSGNKNMYFEIDRLLIRKFINVRQSSNKNMLTTFEEFDFPVVIKYHFNSGVWSWPRPFINTVRLNILAGHEFRLDTIIKKKNIHRFSDQPNDFDCLNWSIVVVIDWCLRRNHFFLIDWEKTTGGKNTSIWLKVCLVISWLLFMKQFVNVI